MPALTFAPPPPQPSESTRPLSSCSPFLTSRRGFDTPRSSTSQQPLSLYSPPRHPQGHLDSASNPRLSSRGTRSFGVPGNRRDSKILWPSPETYKAREEHAGGSQATSDAAPAAIARQKWHLRPSCAPGEGSQTACPSPQGLARCETRRAVLHKNNSGTPLVRPHLGTGSSAPDSQLPRLALRIRVVSALHVVLVQLSCAF